LGIDRERGEANYDIDEDNLNPMQTCMFAEMSRPNKVNEFEKRLKQKILSKDLATDYDVYRFALTSGFLPSHVRGVIKSLKDEKKIAKDDTKARLRFSYDSVESPRAIKVL